MDDKVLAVLLWNQSIPTVWTAQFHRGEAIFIWGEPCSADFTEKLSLGTIIFVQKGLRCITVWAGAVIRNVTFRAAADRTYLLTIPFFVVRDEFLISPVLTEVGDQREFINLELMVFGGMGVIESPLLKGDISADKVKKPADSFMLVLN